MLITIRIILFIALFVTLGFMPVYSVFAFSVNEEDEPTAFTGMNKPLYVFFIFAFHYGFDRIKLVSSKRFYEYFELAENINKE